MASKNIVMVYGTLKAGFRLHGCLEGQKFLGKCLTQANYRMHSVGGMYPALVEVDPGKGVQIKGELYEVSDECLKQLDRVEGISSGLYSRKTVSLYSPELEGVFVYIWGNRGKLGADCGNEWKNK